MGVAVETVLVAVAGAALGGLLGLPLGPVFVVVFAVVAAVAGAFSGYRQVYRWDRWHGWVAFVLDSTWGLLGTSIGVVLHLANLFWSGAEYRPDCARRQNRHVYFGGAALRSGYAFTHGNVMSNADSGRGVTRPLFLRRHEGLHIWQSRCFGPLFQLTYLAWLALAALVAAAVWLFKRSESFYSLVETAAYYDNPFEYWAYVNDHNWPHRSANKTLAWPRPAEQSEEHRKERQQDRGRPCAPPP